MRAWIKTQEYATTAGFAWIKGNDAQPSQRPSGFQRGQAPRQKRPLRAAVCKAVENCSASGLAVVQFVEEGFGSLEVRRIKTLGEPAVNF